MNVRLGDVPGLAAALTAAQTTGLLTALAERPGPAAELAERCAIDERAAAYVLEIFGAFDLLTCESGVYRAGHELSELAARPSSLAQMDVELWQHAPVFLRTAVPLYVMDAAAAEREDRYRDVVAELGKMFSRAATQLAERCDLAPRTILDFGCGSGVWSLALAERLPNARVTGLDFPAVIERFRARAASLGLSDRVDTIAGDMHTVALPSGQWDLAIIANVLRLETAATAQSLVARAVGALRPGGSLLVVDALKTGTPAARQSRAIYALHLALRTRSGRVHAAAEIARWMHDAGCGAPTELVLDPELTAAGALGVLMARKE